MNFVIDSKIAVGNIYGSKSGVSNYIAVINEYRCLLDSDSTTSNVRFIKRRTNKVSHSLAGVTPCHSSIYIMMISSCIINEIH